MAKIPTDKFGCRTGTQAAQINEHLGKRAKTAEELAELTGLEVGRVRDHLKAMAAKGYIVDAYRIKE